MARARWLVPALAMLLAACYESPDVELYEPGVYKGAADPLLDKLEEPALREQLHRRLQRGQTDR